MTFKEDRIENEKLDPMEASSLRYINVPLILLALFLGFGITYLALKTDDMALGDGDSRTEIVEKQVTETQTNSHEMDSSALLEKGKQVYTTTCQACHQANGAGLAGAFPPLEKSDWVNGSPKRLVAIVLHGLQGEITVNGQKYQGVMPPFKDTLSSQDIAAVTSYVRNSFGNKADHVTVDLVEEVREMTKSKSVSWAGEKDLESLKWE